MSVQVFFQGLKETEGNKEKGDQYEKFALEFLKLSDRPKGAWLLKDLPIEHVNLLKLPNHKDNGIDGFLFRDDGRYHPIQAKYRADNSALTENNSSASTFLSEVERLKARPGVELLIAEPIFISNFMEMSDKSPLKDTKGIRWIWYDEQITVMGQAALANMNNKPFVPETFSLRPYQVEDFNKLCNSFMTAVNSNLKQRDLFHAFTGYGKTRIMSEYCRCIHNMNTAPIVIVAPTLKIIEQIKATIKDNWFTTEYHPEIVDWSCLKSEKNNKYKYSPGERQIILSTYDSFNEIDYNLVPQMVIFDEVHRLNINTILSPSVHYLGFTATPTHYITGIFNRIVRRPLNWGIRNKYLTDFQICGFVMTDYDSYTQVNKFDLYAAMICKILRSDPNKRLLVICSRKEDATRIAGIVRGANCNAESVVSGEDGTADRIRKEEYIKTYGGALVSVNIYREGADLPWLNSLFITVSGMNEIGIIQILGRILRLYANKDIARVYIPILAGSQYTDHESVAYEPLTNFMKELAISDPEVFNNPDGTRKTLINLERFFIQGSHSRSAGQNEVDNTPDFNLEELVQRLNIEVYDRYTTERLPKFEKGWLHGTIAAILKMFETVNHFEVNDMYDYSFIVNDYLKMGSVKPDRTMSSNITSKLTNKYKFLKRTNTGHYNIINREGMLKFIGGYIPNDFPLPPINQIINVQPQNRNIQPQNVPNVINPNVQQLSNYNNQQYTNQQHINNPKPQNTSKKQQSPILQFVQPLLNIQYVPSVQQTVKLVFVDPIPQVQPLVNVQQVFSLSIY
jgi:superfamily II DNA or RNA helicase